MRKPPKLVDLLVIPVAYNAAVLYGKGRFGNDSILKQDPDILHGIEHPSELGKRGAIAEVVENEAYSRYPRKGFSKRITVSCVHRSVCDTAEEPFDIINAVKSVL